MPDLRECGCPAWVLRCVHWGDRVLALTELAGLAHLTIDGAFGVRLSGSWDKFTCSCHGQRGRVVVDFDSSIGFPDLPSAEAEFEARELQLLGRQA